MIYSLPTIVRRALKSIPRNSTLPWQSQEKLKKKVEALGKHKNQQFLIQNDIFKLSDISCHEKAFLWQK